MQQLTTEPARPLDTGAMPGARPATGPASSTSRPSGPIEYLDPDGRVTGTVTAATQRAVYLEWCQREGVTPDPRILG